MILRCTAVITLFLLASINLYGQSVLEKSVNFNLENANINEALQKLSEVSEVNIAFSSKLFKDDLKRDFSYENALLNTILTEILKPYRVDFLLLNEQIILKERPKQKFIIYGFVEDSLSGERLIGASVYDRVSGEGAVTNEYGFFSLELEEGAIEFLVTYLGYRSFEQKMEFSEDIELVVALRPSITLAEVVVVATDSTNELSETEIGSHNIQLDLMKNLPNLGGETDAIRIVDLMPGIQTGNDGLGGIHVRGGNPDQNLVLLDGVPVYNGTHLLGIFSMFSDLSVQSVDLQKSNFDSRYGGRLSSIMDIRMREGDRHKYHGGIFLGPLSGKLFFEGPIQKNKSSFFIGGRRLFWDWVLSPLANGLEINSSAEGDTFDYYFYDWNAKANFSLSKSDKIYVSFFKGGDSFRFLNNDLIGDFPFGVSNYRQAIRVAWDNSITAIRWNRVFSPKLFLNTSMTYSQFNFTFYQMESMWKSGQTDFLEYEFGLNKSKIQDATLRFDFDYYRSPKNLMKFGGAVKGQKFDARSENINRESQYIVDNLNSTTFETFNNPNELADELLPVQTPATEMTIFAQNEHIHNEKLTLTTGAYLSLFAVREKIWVSIEPRLNAEYFHTKKISTSVSVTRMSQFLHQVSGSNIGLPSDLWVPSTENIRPQGAWQYSGGLNWNLGKGHRIGGEAYFKSMTGLLSFTTTDLLELPNLEDKVVEGKGKTYGFEFMYEKTSGKTTGWMNYTYSYAWRKFDAFNNGKKFPFRYDRRHYLKTVLMHDFTKKFSMSASWIYGTGNPFTLQVGKFFTPDNDPIAIYSEENEFRLPGYQRLDISFNFTKHKKRGIRTWNISIYNVYNQANPFWITEEPDGNNPNQTQTVQYSSIPFLPSFQYGYRF